MSYQSLRSPEGLRRKGRAGGERRGPSRLPEGGLSGADGAEDASLPGRQSADAKPPSSQPLHRAAHGSPVSGRVRTTSPPPGG